VHIGNLIIIDLNVEVLAGTPLPTVDQNQWSRELRRKEKES